MFSYARDLVYHYWSSTVWGAEESQCYQALEDNFYGHFSCPTTCTVVEEEENEQFPQENLPRSMQEHSLLELSPDLRETTETPRKLRVMLVGKSGSGKSATGNSILDRKVFESKLSSRPVTQVFKKGRRLWASTEIEVMDTPDLLCSGTFWNGELAQRICEALALSSPGPHVVLLVTQLGRFTEEDTKVARRLQEIFGPNILSHTILVFTRIEDLGDGSLDEYLLGTDNQNLAKLDVLLGRRHCGFNNRAKGTEQEAQFQELMKQIKVVLWENEGYCYKNPVYQYSQENIVLKEESGRQVVESRGSEEELGEESWPKGLCRVQKQSESSHRRLLGRELF